MQQVPNPILSMNLYFLDYSEAKVSYHRMGLDVCSLSYTIHLYKENADAVSFLAPISGKEKFFS